MSAAARGSRHNRAAIRVTQSDAAGTPQASGTRDKLAACHHRFVNDFIMLPDSGQARAKLEWE
jgi:hypothetical protein